MVKKIKVIFFIIIISLILTVYKCTFANIDNKYKILVDVEESKLYLFENNILIKTYMCSGGKWNTPSPIGTWKITQKAKWGEGFRTEALWE